MRGGTSGTGKSGVLRRWWNRSRNRGRAAEAGLVINTGQFVIIFDGCAGLPRLRPGSLLRLPAPCFVSSNPAEAFELVAENAEAVRLPTGLVTVRQAGLG